MATVRAWGNLDQGLIWMHSRDPALVEMAAGDPACIKDRAFNYVALLGEYAAEEVDEPEIFDEHAPNALELLIKLLRDGLIAAVDADDRDARPISRSLFESYEIEPYGHNADLALSKPRLSIEQAKGTPQALLFVLLNWVDLLERFPPKAPSEIQDQLTVLANGPRSTCTHAATGSTAEPSKPRTNVAPVSTARKGRREGDKRRAARQALQALFGESKLPEPDGEGAQARAIEDVQDYAKAELNVILPRDTIRREAGIRK